jgi:hypothetical protein
LPSFLNKTYYLSKKKKGSLNTYKVSEVECTVAQSKNVTKKNGLSIISLKELEKATKEDLFPLLPDFAYDSPITRSIGMSLFEVMHGLNQRKPLDLLPILLHV